MAAVLLPLVATTALAYGLGLVFGRRAVLFPLVLGAGFAALLIVNGSDTDSLFITVWLISGVALGVWGALLGARSRA